MGRPVICAKAAVKEDELRRGKIGGASKSIIRPRCFEEVLPEVSEKRVTDIKEEFVEYASFLENLKDTVQRSPVDEQIFSEALEKAGFDNPREEIKNLVNMGIVKQYQRNCQIRSDIISLIYIYVAWVCKEPG